MLQSDIKPGDYVFNSIGEAVQYVGPVIDKPGYCVCTNDGVPHVYDMAHLYANPQDIPEKRKLPCANESWKHRKGDYYTVILTTSIPEPHKASKFPRQVVYKDAEGRVWARLLTSWFDSFTWVPK